MRVTDEGLLENSIKFDEDYINLNTIQFLLFSASQVHLMKRLNVARNCLHIKTVSTSGCVIYTEI